jgi:hypothetical protein
MPVELAGPLTRRNAAEMMVIGCLQGWVKGSAHGKTPPTRPVEDSSSSSAAPRQTFVHRSREKQLGTVKRKSVFFTIL